MKWFRGSNMHCTSDSEINGGIIILFPFCSANFPISSPCVTHPSPIISIVGKKLGFTTDSGRFHNLSLGQRREMVAKEALKKAAPHGHWVLFQVGVKLSLWCLSLSEGIPPQLEGCSQNTKYAVDYSKSSKQLIILFLLLWCNTMNIVLVGCMSCFLNSALSQEEQER